MPPIRSLTAAKPVKTERTHEENQERAYIAASRRSDRSLEARIESARRASEIHKKRTGRGLRVTEQDVVNEEMYEEEDDDLPAQYQRLSAHLQTNSLMFNRKLQDYIATQAAVRNSFMQQYNTQPQYQHQPHYPQNGLPQGMQSQGMQPFASQQMMPPSSFGQSQSFSPQVFQHPQAYRQQPYPMQNRPMSHQRSASMQMPAYQQPTPQASGVAGTPRGDEQTRRMSLPPGALDGSANPTADGQSRPALSRVSTSQAGQSHSQSPHTMSPQQISPQTMSPHDQRRSSQPVTPSSGHMTPTSHSGTSTPFGFMNPSTQSQVLNVNPLSMSLPPESQQLVGAALDPNDPSTSVLMAGSENVAQPFRGTYHYNPNVSPKSSRAWSGSNGGNSATAPTSGINSTLAPDTMKVDTTHGPSFGFNSAMSEDRISPTSMLPTQGYDNFEDMFSSNDFSMPGGQENDMSAFIDWNV